ncbi:MAG: short-chain dehydrogenase [Phycisphaerae bacterium]|nr:short-chain dehydrogenase [Phycisphaerae bacterium]
MAFDFDGKVVVVSGGTGALGTAVVERLLGANAAVVIPVREERELERFPYRDHDHVTLEMNLDLTDADAVNTLYGSVRDLWASIHIAGGFAMGSVDADDAPGQLEKMLALNATTCFHCCSAAIRSLKAHDPRPRTRGRIVNVAARPGVYPREGKGMAAYTASKAAVVAMTEAIAAEVAEMGIWVNAIAPSIMDTPANRAAMPEANHDNWPKVEEVAETIVFLASPSNMVTTGGVVPVYGRS